MSEPHSSSQPTKLQRLLDVLKRRDCAVGREPVHRDLVALFDEEGVDLQVVTEAAFGIVKVGVQLSGVFDASDPKWDMPLLHKALRKGLLTDPDLELLFTAARRSYFDRAQRDEAFQEHDRRMMVSLARQAFNNEYVWAVAEGEQQRADDLAESVRAGVVKATSALVACAMYMPPWRVVASRQAADATDWHTWPDFEELERLIGEREVERRIATEIRSLEMSGDRVTERVRAQYEESPYPRWFGVTAVERSSLAQQLKRRFASVGVCVPGRPLDVLIAGCGTGQQPIGIASRYSDVLVLAIDVSLVSLAHAVRRATELGLTNLEFAHADLLSIQGLGREFDVVESVGVLHHLSDPTAGLRALVRLLRPNGLIKIGVYSRRGRRGLRMFQLRAATAYRTEGTDGLRRVRAAMLKTCGPERQDLIRHLDFYYLSGCRDLLCHEHELTFSPAGLKVWLQSSGAEFLGYAGLKEDTVEAFRRRFSDESSLLDLDLWEQFETERPDTFGSLQVFWARRDRTAGVA